MERPVFSLHHSIAYHFVCSSESWKKYFSERGVHTASLRDSSDVVFAQFTKICLTYGNHLSSTFDVLSLRYSHYTVLNQKPLTSQRKLRCE